MIKGTKVLMYNGTFKNIEDIIVGDVLMGDDNTPRNVLSLTNGCEMMYDVIPVKGDKYTVNANYMLSFKITNIGGKSLTVMNCKYKAGDIVNIPIHDYLTLSKTPKHVLKTFRVGVDFNNNIKPLTIPPRLLGLWLADGSSNTPSFTVNNEDLETIMYLKQECESMNLVFNTKYNSENSNYYYFSKKIDGLRTNNFVDLLKEYNLINNKHIPHVYKTASREERLELLAGILDGDGSLDKNCFDLTLKVERLFDDVLFLTRSLGFSCYKKNVKKGIKELNFIGDYFRMSICGNTDKIPTIVKRKKATIRNQKKNVLMTGIEIIPLIPGDYFNMFLDGNQRCLLSDFTVV